MPEIRAAGGLCAPTWPVLEFIWFHTKSQCRTGWRRFFTWDAGWGFPLVGGVLGPIRPMIPNMKAQRGGLRFQRVESVGSDA